ncbi:N5-glutamine methyltransferase family protein [Microbacterium rhizomatis]|uniref:N5-glutamine methyltransferase family protein n=1 Tax=Microbacterium rhizomatis TaxID=1631477 RepID=UPI001FEA7AA5|nr:class I SAM-dependent methyltransferase [Microbacterium rhizomatis]
MLPEPEPELCRLLAEDLHAADFTAGALREAWGAQADDAIPRGLRGPALRSLDARSDALAVLGRLFVLGVAQPARDVAAAAPRCGVAGIEHLGIAVREGESIRPLVLVRPQSFVDAQGEGEWWIASDLDEGALGTALPEEHVLGVGGASLTLAGLQLPTPAGFGLDLGSGCGIQALRARRMVDRVIATDISERALRFTRLNALLNGIDGIETRLGSLFEPVSAPTGIAETFDRIVSNPPFVITPRVTGVPAYEYRDAGMVGDDLVAAVIHDVGAHLTAGGVAQLLGNWETLDGIDGLDRVRGWVEASPVPMDAWVIERESLDPLAYAELWVRDGGTVAGTPAFAALVDAWLEDFAARGVTRIGFGYVLLRRPPSGDGPTLARYERLTGGLADAPLGAHLAASLAAHDTVVALGDGPAGASALAEAVLITAPDVTEARHHLPGAEHPSVIELRQGGGFARTVTADPGLAALVGACDGDLPVGTLIEAIAQLLEADPAALRAELLPKVRELVFTGFLGFA